MTHTRLLRVVLTVGFLALAGGTLLAHRSPATGYEVSIYTGTPTAVWVALGVALVAAIAAGLFARDDRTRWGGVGLAVGIGTVFAGLPLIRGYAFYGGVDSLTHLGWTREVATGTMSPFDIIYPGVHTVAVALGVVGGMAFTRALMLTVLTFAVLYLVFMGLTARRLIDSRYAAALGVLAALTLLPINNVVTQLNPHPISQAGLYFALVAYLVVLYVGADARPEWVTGLGVVTAIVGVSIVLYHPQQAVVVALMLGTISVAQVLSSRYDWSTPSGRPLYAQTILLIAAFVAWSSAHPGILGQAEIISSTLIGIAFGGGGEVAGVVGQRGASLSAIGTGLLDLFLRLFLVGAIFAILATVVGLAGLTGRLGGDADRQTAVRYLTLGTITLLAFAAVHLVGRFSFLFFRYLATAMVVATLFAVVALDVASRRRGSPSVGRRAAVAVALAVMIVASGAAVFSSPYIYQPSPHKSEMQMDGYATAFDHESEEVGFAGVRAAPVRFRHAITGPSGTYAEAESAPAEALVAPDRFYNTTRYLVVTEADRERELVAYRGLRYSEDDFQGIGTTPGVNRVQTNGEVEVFYVTPSG